MNADGSDFRIVFRGTMSGRPTWSPDGLALAFDTDTALVRTGANGESPTTLVAGEAHNPAWSPDGSRIAYDSPTDPAGPGIFVVTVDGLAVARVTTGDDHSPTWSPDGTKIAFSRGAEGTEDQEIFVVNADGTGLAQLTNNAFADAHPSWSH
jgi:Tol biopolymer transport system component